jgi:hypothetical protein
MSAVIKTDLLLKDELDPIESTASTPGLMEASSFKNKDASANNGCIKDEFTDEMDDSYCCEGDGDQDTETDELNDAEEINDEMTMIEGDEEEEEVEMDEQLADENEDDSLINQEEGEEDPLNDPLLGRVLDPYTFDTDLDPAF